MFLGVFMFQVLYSQGVNFFYNKITILTILDSNCCFLLINKKQWLKLIIFHRPYLQ